MRTYPFIERRAAVDFGQFTFFDSPLFPLSAIAKRGLDFFTNRPIGCLSIHAATRLSSDALSLPKCAPKARIEINAAIRILRYIRLKAATQGAAFLVIPAAGTAFRQSAIGGYNPFFVSSNRLIGCPSILAATRLSSAPKARIEMNAALAPFDTSA